MATSTHIPMQPVTGTDVAQQTLGFELKRNPTESIAVEREETSLEIIPEC